MGFFTSTAAGQQPMDKTSENGWMMQSFLLSLHLMSTTPIQPLPELPGIVVGTTALTFKVGLCPFSFCVTSSKMSGKLELTVAYSMFPALFF
jgi:hypothetical protein